MRNLLLFVSAVASLMAVRWIYFRVLNFARHKNISDCPDERKLQKRPVPVMGGVAVFFGFVFGALAGFAGMSAIGMHPVVNVLPVVPVMLIMMYIGFIDDNGGLSPLSRIVFEVLAVLALIGVGGGCIDSFHGLWGVDDFSWWIAVPLTVVASVGIINSINMIDGVNGLSSGLCIVYSLMFGLAFIYANDMGNAILAFSAAAALMPFFTHNVFGMRSKMYIGDAGTMMFGILMSWFVICLLRSDSRLQYTASMYHFNMVALALAILSVPVADTLRVMLTRIKHGDSPLKPDRKHLHHAFIRVGVSHAFTSLIEICLDLVIVAVWIVAVYSGAGLDMQLYIVIAACVVIVWGLYFVFEWNAARDTRFFRWLTHVSLATQVGKTRWWRIIQLFVDKNKRK